MLAWPPRELIPPVPARPAVFLKIVVVATPSRPRSGVSAPPRLTIPAPSPAVLLSTRPLTSVSVPW